MANTLSVGSEYLLKESGFTKADRPHLKILCKPAEIEQVCISIQRTMKRFLYSDKTIQQTKICLYELINNSMIHGNHRDDTKKVHVFYSISSEKIRISIMDEGDGFNYLNLPDPLCSENELKENGRGMYIVRFLMDEVHFNVKGNRILIVKFHNKE